MRKELTNKEIEQLIESRISMQSTQRDLQVYGVQSYNLDYLKSSSFIKVFKRLAPIQQRGLLNTLAGPYNWKRAAEVIAGYHGFKNK